MRPKEIFTNLKEVFEMNFRISEAAKRIGIHPTTLRDLEKRGIVTARRDWCGYRVFSEDELAQIERKLFYQNQGERKSGRASTVNGGR